MAVHTASAGVGSLEKWQSSSEGSACLLFLWPEFLPDLYLLLCESGWTRQRNHNYVSPLGAEQSQALFSHKLRDLRVKSWTKKKVLQGRGKMSQYRRKTLLMPLFFQNDGPIVLLTSSMCPFMQARA